MQLFQVCRINETNEQVFKENCALLLYYAESSDNVLPTLRDNISVPSSGVNVVKHNSFISFSNIRYTFLARRPSSGTKRYTILNPLKKIICILNL